MNSLGSIRESMSTSSKPLPLKQRTSSQDQRRDYTSHTWISLLRLLKFREFFITVDNFSIWRRHLAWAMEGEGSDLRGYIAQRYSSSMVFMSLLLGAALGVLFNSDVELTEIRKYMRNGDYSTISFWTGFVMLMSIILTILSIISTFTAWGMVNAISDSNAHCILRSSIGQYAAELPSRFIVASVYCFLVWVLMLCILLLPSGAWAYIVVAISLGLFVHVVSVFSAFGRIIMHAGAMGEVPIFDETFERGLLPHGLHSNLLAKATVQLEKKTSIMRQYRYPSKPLNSSMSIFSVGSDLSNSSSFAPSAPCAEPPPPKEKSNHHRRSSSTVRFADNLLNSSTPVVIDSPLSQDHNTKSMPRRGGNRTQRPRPPRAPQIHEASSSDARDKKSGTNGSDAVAEDWLQGSPSRHGGESIKETVQDTDYASTNTSHQRVPSILLPSSYGPAPNTATSTASSSRSETDTVDAKPLLKGRKYWGSRTMVPHGEKESNAETNSPTERTETDDKTTGADSTSESQAVPDPEAAKVAMKPRKYWGNKTQSKARPSGRDQAEMTPKSMTDTSQKAAMAATDAYTRLMARPHGRRPEPAKQPQKARFSTDDRFYEEYGDIFDPGSVVQDDGSGGAATSRSLDVEDPEQHPLLRSREPGKSYDTASSDRAQRTDHDKKISGTKHSQGGNG